MSPWLVALCGCIYFYVGVDLMWKGNVSLGIFYIGAAFSNFGLYIGLR
jgi:hypothetical protein